MATDIGIEIPIMVYEPTNMPTQISYPEPGAATFTLSIPMFDRFCKKGNEKTFSDLAYINDLPWQVYSLVENLHIDNLGHLLQNGNGKIFNNGAPWIQNLVVYLQCNGHVKNREFVVGKPHKPAYVLIRNAVNIRNSVLQKFTARINEKQYWKKIELGNVEQFFEPGFIQIDGSLQLEVHIDT
ncbi:hypothetical protein DdX_10131 [Ditylenchus destructor]|uniref:Uncharacterized protein n=1 Tax=Ditylenchus destructor TaxID=166010 RepID=A0AAD4N1G1_9BILA|nr:hypothetical protein DdX_10131 [Ditylenchus destructor]